MLCTSFSTHSSNFDPIHYQAARRVDALIQQLREDSATLIQSKWRMYLTKKGFEHIISKLVVLQYFSRRFVAWRRLMNLIEAKYLREADASTKIATMWRRSSCRRLYMRTIDGKPMSVVASRHCFSTRLYLIIPIFPILDIIMCQSLARRKFGLKKLAALRFDERQAFARLIKAEWESRVARRRVNRILLNMRSVKCGRAAVKMQSAWRGYVGVQCFAYYRYHAIVLQTIRRKWNARSQYHRSIRGKYLYNIFPNYFFHIHSNVYRYHNMPNCC